MARVHPEIVCYKPSRVQQSLLTLAEVLEMSADETAAKVADTSSSVLRSAPETIRGTMAALHGIPELASVALHVCRQRPAILSYRADTTTAKWQSLRRITALRPEWLCEWGDLPQQPGKLLFFLSTSLQNHQRLPFLADLEGHEGLVRSKPGLRWLTMPGKMFKWHFPGFQQ